MDEPFIESFVDSDLGDHDDNLSNTPSGSNSDD